MGILSSFSNDQATVKKVAGREGVDFPSFCRQESWLKMVSRFSTRVELGVWNTCVFYLYNEANSFLVQIGGNKLTSIETGLSRSVPVCKSREYGPAFLQSKLK